MTEAQIAGCIMGGAIGDACGIPYEGRQGPLQAELIPSEISDDTQLTLATCEAIIEKGGVDPEAIAMRMAQWFKDGRITGIGASTYKSLSELALMTKWLRSRISVR